MSAVPKLRRRLTQMYYSSVRVFCPGLKNSQFAYREALTSVVGPGTTWLDLGCGHQFFPGWMPDSLAAQQKLVNTSASVVGVDAVDLREHSCGIHKVAADIEQLPFADGIFSLVTANMVVEHVENPERLLREVFRVLAPGGIFLFHTPNAKYFEVAIARRLPSGIMKAAAGMLDGRASDDIFQTYYRMNTAREIEAQAARVGLATKSVRHVECTAQGVMLGPLVIFELLIIRMLRAAVFENYRSDLIAMLQKPLVSATRERHNQPQALLGVSH